MGEQLIRAALTGRFKLLNDSGEEISPAGDKLQGLLALLLTEDTMTRRRAWLKDKLWSDRGEQQANDSLRQSVSQIKKALGPLGDIVVSTRKTVGLDLQRVTLLPFTDDEFLEGIDVRDPEFEHWLAEQRAGRVNDGHDGRDGRDAKVAPPSPASLSPAGPPARSLSGVSSGTTSQPAPRARLADIRERPVVVSFDGPTRGAAGTLGKNFVHMLLTSLRDSLMVDVTLHMPETPVPGTIFVSVQLQPTDTGQHCLFALVEDYESRRVFWSAHHPEIDVDKELLRGCTVMGTIPQIAEAVCDALSGHRLNVPYDRDANLLANLAVRKLFTIDKDQLAAADRLLQQAYEIEPRGVFQAWRAQILTIQYVERYQTDRALVTEQSRECCEIALASAQTNSNALAAVAFARLILDKDYEDGSELARLAVRCNQANPLAWSSLSLALMHAEAYPQAHAAAIRSQKLADGTRLKFWTDFSRSIAAAANGQDQEALKFASSCGALAPKFRPALRYLTVFNADAGNIERAQYSACRLASIEPEFSVSRMMTDGNYPAKFLRSARYAQSRGVQELSSQ